MYALNQRCTGYNTEVSIITTEATVSLHLQVAVSIYTHTGVTMYRKDMMLTAVHRVSVHL